MQKYMPIIISTEPKKNLISKILSPFNNLYEMNVIMNVMQFTKGLAMLRSLAATRKLFKMFPS